MDSSPFLMENRAKIFSFKKKNDMLANTFC
jgi:hypothetical protein